MSCTIFYKGALKDSHGIKAFNSIAEKYAVKLDCKMLVNNNRITLFLKDKSEHLVFDFVDNRIDSFCKWNNLDDPQEFYTILDLFIEIKPLFKSLKVEDDKGAWHSYVIQNTGLWGGATR